MADRVQRPIKFQMDAHNGDVDEVMLAEEAEMYMFGIEAELRAMTIDRDLWQGITMKTARTRLLLKQ